jgi:hypothetical protein
MKTLILTTILAFSFLFTTMNSSAEGTDTASILSGPTKMNKICDFAFRIDLSQIIRDAETADLTELNGSNEKAPSTRNEALPFAFKLDTNLVNEEAQQLDFSELDAK